MDSGARCCRVGVGGGEVVREVGEEVGADKPG